MSLDPRDRKNARDGLIIWAIIVVVIITLTTMAYCR